MYNLGGEDRRFLCRDCHGLTYASCNARPTKRIFDKADKLKKKIGAGPGIMYFMPDKPKGMHQVTFYKAVHEIQKLELLGDQAMVKKWGTSYKIFDENKLFS